MRNCDSRAKNCGGGFWVVILLACLGFWESEGLRLDDFIGHYEPLSYDSVQVHKEHSRLRRSVSEGKSRDTAHAEDTVSLEFGSHGRFFKLRLRRDTSTFGEHFALARGTEDVQPFVENVHLFEGELIDLPGSQVYGSIRQGIFDGRITTPNETFYVEKANKFTNVTSSAHSVIYSERDLDHEALFARESRKGAMPCANEELKRWMSKVRNSRVESHEDGDATLNADMGMTSPRLSNAILEHSDSDPTSYSLAHEFSRRKRQVGANMRTTCRLHIRTDPLLWRYIATQEGKTDKAAISEEILSIIGQHVKAANGIFQNTLFEGKMSHKNIQFVVRRVKIETYEECEADYRGPWNPFCEENIDVSNFLDKHSREKYDDFCLSYMFTYRDFMGGVVGLAWVASPHASGASGGICEKYSGYSGFSSNRSLNTGIVTFLNYNRRLPPKISQLTFTHELGHNFGSNHDPDDGLCQPGGKEGNFLMYSSATNGYLKNNAQFSSCSVASIAAVLDKITTGTGRTKTCLEATQSTFCGNQIVEDGEECDCGYNLGECSDNCCVPRTKRVDGGDQLNPRACLRAPAVECSPSEGPCCESDCHFSPRSNHQMKLCQMETDCTASAHCTGLGPHCPKPIPKPSNETFCNNGTQVCIDGVCRGSICVKYGLEECSLTHEEFPDKSTLCNLACVNHEGRCVSLSQLNATFLPNGLKLRPGTPCDNLRGFCDYFSKCRAVDEKGPLLRLTKLFFDRDTYHNTVEWIQGNPWWSGLIGLGFLVFFALFIQCCAVHTPSSNPHLPHHLKFSETLQRPINTLKRRPKARGGGQGPSPMEYELGPPRGRRKGARPLASDRASMAPYH